MPIITITVVSAPNSVTPVGHAFISFNNEPDGPLALGFYPRHEGDLTPELFKNGVRTPGEVLLEDLTTYLPNSGDERYVNQLHVEVSQVQYDAMRNFAVQERAANPAGGISNPRQYDALSTQVDDANARNCVTWVNEVLEQGGLGVYRGLLNAIPPSFDVIRQLRNRGQTTVSKM